MNGRKGETMHNDYTLAELIQARKGDRSYARLSQDCAGNPGASRIQQIVTGPLNDFPSADTMRGLSAGLGVSVTDVILACARSLGLTVSSSDPSSLVLSGAGRLPMDAQDAIREMASTMERWMKPTSMPMFREPLTEH